MRFSDPKNGQFWTKNGVFWGYIASNLMKLGIQDCLSMFLVNLQTIFEKCEKRVDFHWKGEFSRKTPITQNNSKEQKSISVGDRTLKFGMCTLKTHRKNAPWLEF